MFDLFGFNPNARKSNVGSVHRVIRMYLTKIGVKTVNNSTTTTIARKSFMVLILRSVVTQNDRLDAGVEVF